VVARGHRQGRGSSSSGRHARCQWHWPAPPFCATGAAVGLDVAAVDLTGLRDPAFLGQRRQDAGPDAPAAPPVPAVVDGRRWAIFGGAIGPTATAPEHVHDARDNAPVINSSRSGLVLRQVRLDRSPRLIRQPEQRTRLTQSLLSQRRLPESICAPNFKRLIGFGP
jgi:hypothetical protein